MSAQQAWELQQAVYDRLTAQLAGQGPGGANVKVADHVPRDPARVHCRIEGFNVVQRSIKANKTLHRFSVELYDRPEDQSSSARGQKTVKLLQEVAIAALHDWVPGVTGAGAIRHEDSFIVPDADGLTQHASSRFSVHIAQS